MSNEPKKKTEWFPIIAWLAGIAVNVATLGYFIGVQSNTLKQHSESIANNTLEIKELRRELKVLTENGTLGLKSHLEKEAAIEFRIVKLEETIQKLGILQNDFNWFKLWITEEVKKQPK